MKKRNHVRIEVALMLLLVLGICGVVQAAWKICPNFHTVPIPNYVNAAGRPGLYRTGYPEVWGWNVVWTAIVPHPIFPAQRQIFLFDGATTAQVSSNSYQFGAYGPFISSSNNVAYIGDDAGVDFDVFRYNIGTGVTTQLTFTATPYLMDFRFLRPVCGRGMLRPVAWCSAAKSDLQSYRVLRWDKDNQSATSHF